MCTKIQENLLLLSRNSQQTSVKVICPVISSPLLTYHKENVCHAHYSVPHSFPEKYPGEDAKKGSLETYCGLISVRTTIGFLHVNCSCQPCYFPESWLLKAGNHSVPASHYNWQFGWTACLWRACGSVDQRTPSLMFAVLIPENFSVRYLNTVPVCSIALTEFFIIPSLMRRGAEKCRWVLPMVGALLPPLLIVKKTSPSSCNVKSMLAVPFAQ